ncbi:MAG: hypothetical protein V5789_14520 [Colwellia sp.]
MALIKDAPLLSVSNGLLQKLDDKLALFMTFDSTKFSSNKWYFKYRSSGQNRNISLDFSLFDCPHLKFFETIDLIFDGEKYQVNSVELAKILFLEQASTTSYGTFNAGLKQLARLFFFLRERGLTCVKASDYQELFQYFMTIDVSTSGIKQRFSSLGYNTAFAINMDKLHGVLQLYGIEGVLSHTSSAYIKKAQKSAVEVITGLTLADYTEGGSFNFLTLSVGRHYIDHCGNYFQQHYPLARAFRACMQGLPEIIQQEFEHRIGSRLKVERHLLLHIGAVLTGRDILTDPYLISSGRQKGQFIITKDRCKLLERITKDFFWQQYHQACEEAILFSEQGLTLLSKHLKLPKRFDSFEFLRSMLLTQLTDISAPRGPEALLRQYSATLKGKREITLEHFFDSCDEVKKELLILTPQSDQSLAQLLTQANIPFASNSKTIREFIGNVEAAGGISMLALTGWRASEYGFPLAAIKVTDNQDILDSTYTPFRFILNWIVPKTNGKTKLDREITLSAYLLAYQMDSLIEGDDTTPCLYYSGMKRTNIHDSSKMFSSRVLRMWEHFVNHYTIFVNLRQLDTLKNIEVLTEDERKDLTLLMEAYPDNAYTAEFRYTMRKVTDELPRIQVTGQLSRNKYDRPGHMLFGFIKGTLNANEMEVWLQHLDPLLQKQLTELTIKKPADLSSDLIKTCTASMLSNCAYPTPHAFRHIWAEAVLRRYSGDVGWFIRSHFKHLDERFFMRYLRLKNFKDIHDIAKRTAVSAIVRMHLLTLQDEHREYTGKFDVFMRRLGKTTMVVSIEELPEIVEQFVATEVIDLKANSWCNCILRRTTEKQAKCAVDGVPQRQNADPSLCLGCINGNIEEGHVVGIMLQVENDVKILKNHELPQFFKSKSKSTVIEARKQFLQLKRNSGSNKYDNHIKYFDDALVMGG